MMRNLIKPSVIHQPEFCFLMFFVCFSVVMEDVLFFFFEFLMKKNPPEVAHGGRDGLREALNLSRSCWLAQSWMGTLIPDRSL